MSDVTPSGLHVVQGFRNGSGPFQAIRDLDEINEGRRHVSVVNESGLDTATVLRAAVDQRPDIAAIQDALVTWTSGPGPGQSHSRAGGLAERDLYVNTRNIFDEMHVAARAAEDDVVAAFLDSSEALAFSRMELECDEEDEMDIWGQIMQDIDVDNRMREIWRDLNVYSQCYAAVWFGRKSYKVRGKNSKSGVMRKKEFKNLVVPLGVTTLDPLKVIPVGNFLFQQETLCYYANPTEKDVIDSWLLGDDDSGADEIIRRLIVAKFEPDFRDRKEIGNLGVDVNRLYVLNPKYVWRHTTTKPGYDRFAPLRFKSIFELLDLKRQLKAMDRAHLIGATNYLLLIKKGSDKEPAKQYEIANLQQTARTLSKVPILVGDHRLNIEIITPKIDYVLDDTKYQSINLDIQGRLYGMFMTSHAGRDDSLKLARVAARGLESRRLMQKRAFMRKVIMPTYQLNDSLRAEPDLVFHPKRIALDFDPSLATYLLDLRDRGDLSRDSVLSEIDYDEASEAAKRQVEAVKYDKIFQPPIQTLGTPPGQTAPNQAPKKADPGKDPKVAGRAKGGNHNSGGNGNIGRGAGRAAVPKPTGQNRKGIVGQPKLNRSKPDDTGATDND